MKTRLLIPASLFLMLLFAALATGNPLLLVLAAMVLLVTAVDALAVLWAASTMEVSAEITEETVHRGDDVSLLLRVRHRGHIPIAPVVLELTSLSGGQSREIRLKDQPGRLQSLKMQIHAAHVGVFDSGIRACRVEDLLGIFRMTKKKEETLYSLTVLPQIFETNPLKPAPGDPGSEMMARATEDLSAPSEIRAYQPGDAMKKIHWKLSVRKGELMVRKFDEPVLQEILILMDCSRPPSWGHPQAEADIRDALLETAASLYSDQLKTDHTVRMPLLGGHPADIDQSMGLRTAFDYLVRTEFSETDRFERVLMMESRRLQKVGCVAVVSARLNGAMVDMMIRMHRMGPNMRLYLVTFAPDDPNILPLISRLRAAGIEVEYVTPVSSGAG